MQSPGMILHDLIHQWEWRERDGTAVDWSDLIRELRQAADEVETSHESYASDYADIARRAGYKKGYEEGVDAGVMLEAARHPRRSGW